MCGLAGCRRRRGDAPPRRSAASRPRWRRRSRTAGRTTTACGSTPTAGVALGHRRLAILDLCPLGHQPMRSADGRFVADLQRRDLQLPRAARASSKAPGVRFRGTSDTEVLLAASQRWGVAGALRAADRDVRVRAVGPHASARSCSRAIALGIKPLYCGDRAAACSSFGSELKALRAHPRLRRRRSIATRSALVPALRLRARRRTRSSATCASCAAASCSLWRRGGTAPRAARRGGACASVAARGSRDERIDDPREATDAPRRAAARRSAAAA